MSSAAASSRAGASARVCRVFGDAQERPVPGVLGLGVRVLWELCSLSRGVRGLSCQVESTVISIPGVPGDSGRDGAWCRILCIFPL